MIGPPEQRPSLEERVAALETKVSALEERRGTMAGARTTDSMDWIARERVRIEARKTRRMRR